MNKAQLINNLALHNDIEGGTKVAAERVLNFIIESIMEELKKGEEVTIAGFGKFYVYKLASGKVVPKFKAFENFKEAIV
jgi:DNA-binding protein HU-beta